MIIPKVTVTGLDAVLADIDNRLARMSAGIRADLDWFGDTTTTEMRETHTFVNRTGYLESSINYAVLLREGHWDVNVEASAWYAEQVEFGHPGPPPARPYPFFWPVFYKWEPELWERVQATVDRELSGGVAL